LVACDYTTTGASQINIPCVNLALSGNGFVVSNTVGGKRQSTSTVVSGPTSAIVGDSLTLGTETVTVVAKQGDNLIVSPALKGDYSGQIYTFPLTSRFTTKGTSDGPSTQNPTTQPSISTTQPSTGATTAPAGTKASDKEKNKSAGVGLSVSMMLLFLVSSLWFF
jgi:hypothetical protein